ncbi:MAG TPA: DUF4384 domain-containing protein [Gemmatimonadales bacterium]|nr:DUF4384 domain-containing protein [Gemmatimonadales bacterium]
MVGILGLVLLTQTPVQVAAHPAKLGVRAWLPDTLLPVGAPARVYVELEDSGYLALLHVEPSGRIRVLYPEHPNDPAFVPGGAAFVVGGISDSTTFRVVAPGTGALLAVRSWTPLDFAGLVDGNRWDYARALLLQPTAGNPLAALLDIADRITDGEAYTYDLTGYRTPGALAARRTTTDSVCGNCFSAHHQHSDAAAADGDAATIAIDHSMAASGNGSVVDCSYATLTSSFCGVDNSVTTYQESTAAAPAPEASSTVVYPYYPQGYYPYLFFHRRRTEPPPPLPPPAIALNLHAVPRAIVPPPPRRIPRITVTQPTAPSRPVAVSAADPGPAPQSVATAAAPLGRRFAIVRPADPGTRVTVAGPSAWAAPAARPTRISAPAAATAVPRVSGAAAAAAPGRVVVPSHAAVERARGH